MRKCLTILAVACLFFLISGYQVLYQVRLAEVKSAMKKALSATAKEHLTRLALSPAEAGSLEWEDESEFRYGNKMYDVAEAQKEGGQMIYWCFADDEETALVEAYLQTQNPSSDKDASHSLSELLKVPFLPVVCDWTRRPAAQKSNPSSFYFHRLCSLEGSVLTPPPKAC